MLSRTKRQTVKQLLENEPAFLAALDRLLPYVGIWPSWELGSLKSILQLHCPTVSSFAPYSPIMLNMATGKCELLDENRKDSRLHSRRTARSERSG
jgi:hypothetical protein